MKTQKNSHTPSLKGASKALLGGALFAALGASSIANASIITLDPAAIWGASGTAITVTAPGTSTAANRGTFTVTDVEGSGIDIQFTITGDPLRTGSVDYPRTLTHGTGVSIQGSADHTSVATLDSVMDTQTAGPLQTYATRGYKIEFFDTGTTDLRGVSNLTLTIGDIDELERYGLFGASLGGSAEAITLGALPISGFVTAVPAAGGDSLFLRASADGVTNGTTTGDVDVKAVSDLDTFSFTAEKGRVDTNLGVTIGLLSFDTQPAVVPEPSTSLLLGLSFTGLLLRRKR